VSELEAGSFVEVKEEDNKYGVPSDEMSVAINLAKLSQVIRPSKVMQKYILGSHK